MTHNPDWTPYINRQKHAMMDAAYLEAKVGEKEVADKVVMVPIAVIGAAEALRALMKTFKSQYGENDTTHEILDTIKDLIREV